MPGAVAAIVAARRSHGRQTGATYRPTPVSAAEERRRQAARKEYERRVRLAKIIRTYDANKSGKLEKDQVVKLLTDMDGSTPPGTQPTDDELEWIMRVADKAGDGCIDRDELEMAMGAWDTYINLKQEMEDVMATFDIEKNGTLSREEVSNYLKKLNGGMPVTDEEVKMVFDAADVEGDGQIDLMELTRATALWYGYVEEQKKKEGCCTVQ
eukprot:TRINITY_DN11724_c0_g1_i1.p1 TRINITY_DN11724_c0_g1~~TRINITY_DN11724_c0_g1_i1.p1  ORF type:complete len:211 (+),score=85.64 TRINITY_DN11724_c0_g1_i1:76-708(+)